LGLFWALSEPKKSKNSSNDEILKKKLERASIREVFTTYAFLKYYNKGVRLPYSDMKAACREAESLTRQEVEIIILENYSKLRKVYIKLIFECLLMPLKSYVRALAPKKASAA